MDTEDVQCGYVEQTFYRFCGNQSAAVWTRRLILRTGSASQAGHLSSSVVYVHGPALSSEPSPLSPLHAHAQSASAKAKLYQRRPQNASLSGQLVAVWLVRSAVQDLSQLLRRWSPWRWP